MRTMGMAALLAVGTLLLLAGPPVLAEDGALSVTPSLPASPGPSPAASPIAVAVPGLTRVLDGDWTLPPERLTAVGGAVAFLGVYEDHCLDEGEEGCVRLWWSDGTAAGTRPLDLGACGADDCLGFGFHESGSVDAELMAVGERLFFELEHLSDYKWKWEDFASTERQLWVSDGTAGGTRMVRAIGQDAGIALITAVAGRLLFVAGSYDGPELWVSDGTRSGTRAVTHFLPRSCWPEDRGRRACPSGDVGVCTAVGGDHCFDGGIIAGPAVGDRLFFVARDRIHGPELWVSDGTARGTHLVRDIRPSRLEDRDGYDVPPISLAALGDRLVFSADDGVHGRELWVSDGTRRGTRLVKDVRPGRAGYPAWADAALVGKRLLVFLDSRRGVELWVSDGTAAGTRKVRRIGTPAPRRDRGECWWDPFLPTRVGRTLYFVADDGEHGSELWASDGTRAGTRMVKDILPGPGCAAPSELTDMDGTLYFAADDGVHGRALWRSDGTEMGTTLVADIGALDVYPCDDPGCWWTEEGPSDMGPTQLTAVGGALFLVADDGVHGRQLWRFDPGDALR